MSEMIRHVSELPEWFDIRPYEQWEDKRVPAIWPNMMLEPCWYSQCSFGLTRLTS